MADSTRGDLRPPDVHADERATLQTFLTYLRESTVAKLAGVDEDSARRQLVPSGTSLLWLVKHLAAVELVWFVWAYAGEDGVETDCDDQLVAEDSVASVIARYRIAVARADQVIAACTDLGRPGLRSGRETEPQSMRWILVHMIEETARHAGHADILREQIDGSVGR